MFSVISKSAVIACPQFSQPHPYEFRVNARLAAPRSTLADSQRFDPPCGSRFAIFRQCETLSMIEEARSQARISSETPLGGVAKFKLRTAFLK